jgi:hypothetical protein
VTPLDQAFRNAQWHVPYGWHVEGQVLPLEWGGYVAAATWTAPGKNAPEKGTVVYAIGYTVKLALLNLSERFYEQRRLPGWRHIAAPARAQRLIIVPILLSEINALQQDLAQLRSDLDRIR